MGGIFTCFGCMSFKLEVEASYLAFSRIWLINIICSLPGPQDLIDCSHSLLSYGF